MPVTGKVMSLPINEQTMKGSFGDSSSCDQPPLIVTNFRRNQLLNQANYVNNKSEYITPTYKLHNPRRKRFKSMSDRDYYAGSSGYETGSKPNYNSSELTGFKPYCPVMENRVSSTNSDNIVYIFSGPTPKDNFQVTYTVEERVRAAAFAIVFQNCKISTEKFESLYDKPAPDFKTIFAWRQRLLTTGCLVDSHLDHKKDTVAKSPISSAVSTASTINIKDNKNKKVINPEEISIESDSNDEESKIHDDKNIKVPKPDNLQIVYVSDEDSIKTSTVNNKLAGSNTTKADTELVTPEHQEVQATGSSISTLEERYSLRDTRSHSVSTRQRTRSSSQVSQDSNYPDSDFGNPDKKKLSNNVKPVFSKETSIYDSDSESISYNSEEENFLSRVFGENRKPKRKFKKCDKVMISANQSSYVANNEQSFQGYRTMKKNEHSPLATGNIYTPNLRNMNLKNHSISGDTDGYLSEYVPTKLGSTAMKNYQDFKNNVRKKGFWAKGNGTSIPRNVYTSLNGVSNKEASLSNIAAVHTSCNKLEINKNITIPKEISPCNSLEVNCADDFTKDECDNILPVDNYLLFDNSSLNITPGTNINNTSENTDRVFAVVQTNSAKKNKSIMDIFDTNNAGPNSPETPNDSENYEQVNKIYETEWDEDDDALYKNTDIVEQPIIKDNDIAMALASCSIRSLSPVSGILYATDKDLKSQEKPNLAIDCYKEKQETLLSLLKDLEGGKTVSDLMMSNKIEEHADSQRLEYSSKSSIPNISTSSTMSHNDTISLNNTNVVKHDLLKNSSNCNGDINVISPSKKVHVIESLTILPSQINSSNLQLQVSQQQPSSTPTMKNTENTEKIHALNMHIPELDLSNLLAGINTNNLLLALQNLQQVSQSTLIENGKQSCDDINSKPDNTDNNVQNVETINLTNDEEWEKESNRDGSIERMLEKLDGTSTEDTPFLSDIFDPGPVVIPTNVPKKLNINLINSDETNNEKLKPNINENAPVIGNFKSFALPKPILLNRLKLSIKQTEKSSKNPDIKMKNRRRKVCTNLLFIYESPRFLQTFLSGKYSCWAGSSNCYVDKRCMCLICGLFVPEESSIIPRSKRSAR